MMKRSEQFEAALKCSGFKCPALRKQVARYNTPSPLMGEGVL